MKKNTTGAAESDSQKAQNFTGYEPPPMQMKVKINSISPEGATRARLSISFGDVFAIRGVRLMDGKNGMFLSMPSYKVADSYKDVCFSYDEKFTEYMTGSAIQAYTHTLQHAHQLTSGDQQQGVPQLEAHNQEAGQQMAGM